MNYILGISAFYHDSAAAIIKNGKIVAAAQEERFTRKKHDSSYPYNAIKFVLDFNKINLSQVDKIIFFEKPFLKFERLLETYVGLAPRGFKSFCKSIPIWLKYKLFQKKYLLDQLKRNDSNFNDKKKIYFSEHHLSHAASAFFPSPFEDAIILTADGVGEWATTTVAIGRKNKIEIKKEIHFPHSLGLLYSAFTYYIGFKVNSGEYKLMGLAPYGKPIYEKKIINNLIDIKEDGSFKLDQSYFNYATGLTMTSKKFENLFGNKPRKSEKDKICQFHMDIASSIQKVTEDILLKILRSLKKEYKIPNLCLAGGVALNCVANGKIFREKIFNDIWVQPAAGDAGGSIGAALALWHIEENNPRKVNNKDDMQGSLLGPKFDQAEIEKELIKIGAKYSILNEEHLIEQTAEDLNRNEAIGWFQGRMEFGPRALGSRSILGNPRSNETQKNLNLKIKFRESFRPFAPSILLDDVKEWFEFDYISPYMLMVANVKKNKLISNNNLKKNVFGIERLNLIRSEIPAVTHVDNTARIQTVTEDSNQKYFKLIKKFKEKTGCPIIVNTSFNVRGEPIVNTPQDAFRCFMGTGLDKLVIGNCYLEKSKQTKKLFKNYSKNFELD